MDGVRERQEDTEGRGRGQERRLGQKDRGMKCKKTRSDNRRDWGKGQSNRWMDGGSEERTEDRREEEVK